MKTGPMLVGHEPTVTVASTPVAPLQASVQSPETASVSPGARLTATESSEPSVLPARWVTKCTTTDAAPWYFASFLRRGARNAARAYGPAFWGGATRTAARAKAPTPPPRPPPAIVSGGSGVGDAVGVGAGVRDGA